MELVGAAKSEARQSRRDFGLQEHPRIGDSLKKEGEGNKTGRFNVGVKCVYHLTEVPMITRGRRSCSSTRRRRSCLASTPNPGKIIGRHDHDTKYGART